MASLKIETGIKTYDIEDENGEIRGQIKINTSDIGMLDRAQKAKDNISTMLETISNADLEDEKGLIELTTNVDSMIKKEINILFDDDNISTIVFGNQSCLNTLNGISFVERFLDVIMPVIYKDFEVEMSKSKKRVEKYTSQVKK